MRVCLMCMCVCSDVMEVHACTQDVYVCMQCCDGGVCVYASDVMEVYA